MSAVMFPDGKKFAFTILDESDDESVESTRPVYELLESLGLRTTKTVAALRSRNANAPESLENSEYREFVLSLRDKGFEIGWRGAAAESNQRDRTIEGLEKFREVIGHYPRVYANNALNRENLYWGPERVDQPLLKAVVQRTIPSPSGYFLGHVEESAFWWGDLCAEHIDYVRNLTFEDVNLARINPSMPYHDPSRPLVNWWFSCSDADDVSEFSQLLRPDRQERLEQEGGWCIVATRFSNGFVKSGKINRLAQKRLEAIAARGGWYVPVGELLDHLRTAGAPENFAGEEWDRMQWKWARDLVRRKLRQSRRPVDPTIQEPAISRT